MNNLTKTIVYVVLVIAAIWFGTQFYSNYKAGKARGETELTTDDSRDSAAKPAAPEAPPATNAVAQDTNAVAPAPEGTPATNVVAETNAAPATNAVTTAPAPETPEPKEAKSKGQGSMIGYLGAFLVTIFALGFFVAKDVSNMLGQGTIDFLFNDDLKGVYDPKYEEALNAVHKGQFLEAIQILREFLQENPHAQYAALEIAEIYEKKLNNHLAAALEYEEVLKKKLQPERWGWAAIHLCNLYSKMGKSEKTLELLRRIVKEYGQTAAAKKAAKRLAMYESGGDDTSLSTDVPEGMEPLPTVPKVSPAAPAAAPEKPGLVVKVRGKAPGAAAAKEEPASNLPPGFRPKK